MSDVANIMAGYDRWAAVYDTDKNLMQTIEGLAVRRMFGLVEGLKVLDFGCGTGRHALCLAENGAVVTALDFSEGMLSEARRKPEAYLVDFLPHDLREPLPYADSKFYLVVSGLVLEHLDDLDLFFAEIHRVVKPLWRAIVSGMHPVMFLRGSQARFIDTVSGDLVRPSSVNHKLGDMIIAAVKTDFEFRSIGEHSPDETFIDNFDMKPTSIDWPMVIVFELCRTE